MTTLLKLYRQILREAVQNHIYQPKTCYYQIRSLNTEVKQVPSEDLDVVGYTKRDNDFKISRTATVKRLVDLFHIDLFEAIDLASKHSQLCEVSGVQLSTNYQLCLDNGLKQSTIEKCVDVLAIKDLSHRIPFLCKLGKVNDVAPLLRLTPLTLMKLEKDFTNNNNSIYYLAGLLKVTPFEISEEFVKKPFLHRLSFTKISQIVELLMENGITGPMIANDLTALKYSLKTIQGRIAYAKECNVPELKTWMIRVDAKIFRNYIKIRSDNKEILGDKSIAEYLSERLDCSVATANYLVTKLPALNNKSVKKMSEIIDYLYAAGYIPTQICRVPKILLHSFETTKKRVEKLSALGVEVNSLYILIKSQRAFQDFHDNLVRSLKKRKKLVDS